MDRGLLALAFGAVAVTGVALAGWDDRGAPPAGQQVVDVRGVRFEVPDDWVVQDIAGRVDGQLACPDAPGYVLSDDMERESYTAATCDPPGDQVTVRLSVNPDMTPNDPGRPGTSPGGVDYVPFLPAGVVFVDAELWVAVDGPGAEAVLDDLVASATPSPDGDLAPPTTAEAETATTDRLADELGCDTTEVAATYSRAGTPAFLGRQAEAPVDCYAGGHGFRILAFRDDAALAAARAYYAEGAWLIVGDRWAITALSGEAAQWAEDRTGGAAIPPATCCGPPTSDSLPGTDDVPPPRSPEAPGR